MGRHVRRILKLGLVGIGVSALAALLNVPLYTLRGTDTYTGPQLVSCSRSCVVPGLARWTVSVSLSYHFFNCGTYFNSYTVVAEGSNLDPDLGATFSNPTVFGFNHPFGWFCGSIPTSEGTSP